MASALYSSPGSASNRRAPRSKSGCLTCRRRKVRCNEQKPRCSHCERLNLQCNWRPATNATQASRRSSEIINPDYEANVNPGSSSTQAASTLLETRNTGVEGSFNDAFNYASFMWDQDLESSVMQPARWKDLGFPEMDVFAPKDDLCVPDPTISPTFLSDRQNPTQNNMSSLDVSEFSAISGEPSQHCEGETPEERVLKDYFIQTVVPPILAQVETQLKWSSMRQVLISMSRSSMMVNFAILAFSQLLMGRNLENRTSEYQRFYNSAKAEFSRRRTEHLAIKDSVSSAELDHILATLFFLSYIDLLEGRIVDAHANLKDAYDIFQEADKTQLRMVSKRLISWLRLLDGRAVSAGGEGLFLSDNDEILAHSSPASTDIADSGNSSNDVEADIEDVLFDALYQPGFFFFQRIQSFMGRISKIDPWHRSRGTVDDETEVMSISSKISRDLGALWDSRPPLMDYALNGKLNSAHISESLAFTLTRTFRTYFANFNASRIHLHRVAYKHLPLSRETEQAILNIRTTAKIMVDTSSSPANEQEMLPVNMLWPLLMWGCEENDPEVRGWIVAQINNMEQVATNARITAQVLIEVQNRQDASKQRVDVRTVMHDIFNSCFAILKKYHRSTYLERSQIQLQILNLVNLLLGRFMDHTFESMSAKAESSDSSFPIITIIGSLNVDLTTYTSRIPTGGETCYANSFKTGSGGKGSNQASACGKLSRLPSLQNATANIQMIGAVGNDEYGRTLIRDLQSNGVDASRVLVRHDIETGVAVVLVEEDSGENRILVNAGANHSLIPEQFEKLPTPHPSLLVLQLEIPVATVVQILKTARQANVDVLLNPAPALALPDEAYLGLAHLVLNETEAVTLSGCSAIQIEETENLPTVAAIFHQKGVKNVIITLGGRGVFYSKENGECGFEKARKVPVVDTTAAGDTFIGAYALEAVKGEFEVGKAEDYWKQSSIYLTSAGPPSQSTDATRSPHLTFSDPNPPRPTTSTSWPKILSDPTGKPSRADRSIEERPRKWAWRAQSWRKWDVVWGVPKQKETPHSPQCNDQIGLPLLAFSSPLETVLRLLEVFGVAGIVFKMAKVQALDGFTIGVASFAAIGTFLFGFDSGIATTTIAHESFLTYMDHPSTAWIGAVAAVYIAGEAFGAITQIAVGDKLGRLRIMQIMCVIVTIATIIQTAAVNYGMYLAGRVLAGYAVGALVGTVPVYLSEISSPQHRGLIGGISGCGISLGTMMSNWVGYACGFAPYGPAQWRLPLGLQIPFGIIMFLGLVTFMPDSPRQLIRAGKIEKARAEFLRIRRDLDAEELLQEFAFMHSQIDFEMQREITSYREIFRLFKHRVLVSVAVQTMTSLTGTNVISYYQTILYKSLGINSSTILCLAGVYGTIGFITNCITTKFLTDQWGRRKMILTGLLGIMIVQIYAAIMQMKFQNTSNTVGKAFAVLGIYLFSIVYYGMINSTTWIYGAEVLPIALRSKVMGLGALGHFIVNVGITEAGPTAFAKIKQNYYYVFVGCCSFFLVMAYLFFPETKQKSLEEIAAAFGDKVVDERVSAEEAIFQAKGSAEHSEVAADNKV
ncbi:hypothetical protein G7Y89_g11757 [Cudoniella acicularis]|uniref:Ribokinase n=1 Tax=Cudoniella acicularis TaxID=354080 RepID=A0A8H4RCJ7_9HELO|nr:hypothetical protein G7Y89_g11757 [Cudoniella acicularis]